MLSIRIAAFVTAVLPSVASAADFSLTHFNVSGEKNVSVTAVNDFGVATGSFYTAERPYGSGFVGRLGQTVILPRFGNGHYNQYNNPAPTGINNAGAVIGTYFADGEILFVWQNGRYVVALDAGEFSRPQGIFPPYIGSRDRISYNFYVGSGDYIPMAGTPKSQAGLSAGGFPFIASINATSQVSGQFYTFVGNLQVLSTFFGTTSGVQPLLPPDAQSSSGGWVNDSGEVAGAYQTAREQRGFVYTGSTYHTFRLPTAPTALAVQGIDRHGQVVGAYSDSNAQYGFVYAHGKASQIGSFPLADTVHVGISQSGKYLVVSDAANNGTVNQSYLVSCTGSGCP